VGDGSFLATDKETMRLVCQLAIVEDVESFRAGDGTVYGYECGELLLAFLWD
jgi:hypothetical protein